MEKMDTEDVKPTILRSGRVLGSVELKKPQRKKRKTTENGRSSSKSASAGAPSDGVAAALPIEPKPPEQQDDGMLDLIESQDVDIAYGASRIKLSGKTGILKKSVSSAELAGGSKTMKRPKTLRIKIEPVDPESTLGSLQMTSIQEGNDEGNEPSCSIKQEHSGPNPGQGRVRSSVDHTEKLNNKPLIKRDRNPKKLNLTESSETSAPVTMADAIEMLCLNTGASQVDDDVAVTIETQQQKEFVTPTSSVDVEGTSTPSVSYIDRGQKKNDAVEDGEKVSIGSEKVLVSIPINPRILAATIKLERNVEGHGTITQQQCCSDSHRSIEQKHRPGRKRVVKNTASTADRTDESNDKKIPKKRGRKSKKYNLQVTSEAVTVKEEKTSSAATFADTIERRCLNTITSQDGGAVGAVETLEQPLYMSDSEEILEISDVADIPPKDNHVVVQTYEVGSIFDMAETNHSPFLQLRKPFQRLLVREWFYSNIDQCLLDRGNGVQDMETLLGSQLAALTTRRLNRAAWNHIRDILRRLSLVQPRRRCSEKFFLDERMHLEQRREKVRFLQAHPMFEYLDDDLPADLPVGIEPGDSVETQLNEPYGVFRGVVVKSDGPIPRSYTVHFEDPTLGGQIVSDIQIASAKRSSEPTQVAEIDETVMFPKNLSKQLVLFKDQLEEKEKLLNEMECLRFMFNSIREHSGTQHAQDMMRMHQRRYLDYIEDLQTANSSISLIMRMITRLGLNLDEVLINNEVVQIGQRLQDMSRTAGNIPLGNGILEFTLRQLRGPPSRIKELQVYLQSNKFAQ